MRFTVFSTVLWVPTRKVTEPPLSIFTRLKFTVSVHGAPLLIVTKKKKDYPL